MVNILGCLLIGLLGGISETKQIFSPEIRAMLLVGFLGGFTTFSAFGYDLFTVLRDGQVTSAMTNLFLHILLGLGSVWVGFSISRFI
jgi:CrcB protein